MPPRCAVLALLLALGCVASVDGGLLGRSWLSLGANQPAAVAEPATEDNSTDLIVVFKDLLYVPKVDLMCSSSKLKYAMLAPAFGLSKDCHMPGICRHIFSNTIFGFSGKVTSVELKKLKSCLPGAFYYSEENQVVHKAEDDDFWRPQESGQQHSQQQQHLRHGQADISHFGRRMQQSQSPSNAVPQLKSFEESVMTEGSEGPPIDPTQVTGGIAMTDVGVKTEELGTKLWNLDRIDQRDLPLNGQYQYGTTSTRGTGNGTTVYVVDSGIKKDHQEFEYWSGEGTRASYGYDFVDSDDNCDDCDGHGTHVAATAVGLSVGVAKDAKVVSVRILDCDGSGTISNTVAALDWVAANHVAPAVVTLSLGIQVGSWSRVLEDAVSSLISTHGITVVVAAGNSAVDACYVAPANVGTAITVAASDVANKYNGTGASEPDTVYKWSNSGPCVKLFAPGVDIYSACGGASRCTVVDNESYTYASGTSMAVPHVAGVVATYLEAYPQSTPADVSGALLAAASSGKIDPSQLATSTPNVLLYSWLTGEDTAAVQAASGP